jgi:hypothetical protein
VVPKDLLLRWTLPSAHPGEQHGTLRDLWFRIPPFLRLTSGVSRYYAMRLPGEGQLSFVTTTEDADRVTRGLRELIGSEPERVLGDPVLAAELTWYRARLHHVSDIALSIREDLNDPEYRLLRVTLDLLPSPGFVDHFEMPSGFYEAELHRLLSLLARPAFSRANARGADGGSFWDDFVRRPHHAADVLPPPGYYLWNLLSFPD